MINGTNLTRKDNPRWPSGDVPEALAFALLARPGLAAPRGSRRRIRLPEPSRLTRLVRVPERLVRVPERLGRLTHRAGAWLFAKADTEARWRHWQITQLRGGLARRYRDPRFDALRSLHDVAEQMRAQIDPARQGEQDHPPR